MIQLAALHRMKAILKFKPKCTASMVYAVIMCLCACLCVSHASIVSKWLNVWPCKQCHMIAKGL